MPKFVVLALAVRDTAIMEAPTDQDAIETYETPEELEGEDILTWAMPLAEFEEMTGLERQGG